MQIPCNAYLLRELQKFYLCDTGKASHEYLKFQWTPRSDQPGAENRVFFDGTYNQHPYGKRLLQSMVYLYATGVDGMPGNERLIAVRFVKRDEAV